jgi:D-beta-D-heptose 7-phosphate kinase/D-beta-D-heptose 1-phosphate adenosyltransferase
MIAKLAEILSLVEAGWNGVRVLVVGDVMLDKYVWGEVERISPEAPVPVVRATLRDAKPGGAANVAMNLAGLGAQVTLVGFGGGDPEQGTLESLLAQAGIQPSLTTVSGVPTTTKLRILSGSQQMMRLDIEAPPAFSLTDYQGLLNRVFAALPNASVVVLSDYAKGVLTADSCQTIIGKARDLKIPVLVDPKNRSFAGYRVRPQSALT